MKIFLKGIALVALAIIFISPAMASFDLYAPTTAETLAIKGTRVFSFSSKSMEGTKEGFMPGTNREESLRINISGKVQETEVNANLFSTSLLGVSNIASREETVSILLKRGSLEAYFGDFTPDIDGLEFVGITKVLSGLQVKGEFPSWGFKAIASTPKGTPQIQKLYGNKTQGPYDLGASPVVINSERVYVNGMLQKRGTDYNIDYAAGTITFIQRIIDTIAVIEVRFDSSQTVFCHSTNLARGKIKPFDNLKVGLTYIDDSDTPSPQDALIKTASTEPETLRIIGGDGEFSWGSLINIKGEAAYSEKSPNETGKALKLDLSSELGPFGFLGKYKRVTPNYNFASDALPKRDLKQYSGVLSFKALDLILAEGYYDNDRYDQGGTYYEISDKKARLKLTPPIIPQAEYIFDELIESNDPVTTLPFDRISTKNTLELNHSLWALKITGKGSYEKRIVRIPSIETTVYKIANAGASFSPSDIFQASTNLELKETINPDSSKPLTKTCVLNISTSPKKEYLLAGSLNYVDDDQDGVKQVTDISFKADPIPQLRTSGKYTVSALKETFGLTLEGIRKEEGSLNLDFRPIDRLRMRYYLKPNFTRLNRTGGTTYNNKTEQYETNFFLFNETMLGYSNQINSGFAVDKTDYPNYQRIMNALDETIRIYSVKTAPFKILSCELNYTNDDKVAQSLNSTAEPVAYATTITANKQIDVAIKTSLSQKYAIDGSYTYLISRSGSQDAGFNITDTISQTGTLKLIFNLSDALTITPSYSYSQSTNYLLQDNRDTYTLSPGAGLTIKLRNGIRIDGTATYSKSYAGSSTEKTTYNIRGIYNLSDFIRLTGLTNIEMSRNPDYKTTELTANLEINL